MKVTECALSLFLLLGSTSHQANAFQIALTKQTLPSLSRVESSSPNHSQSNLLQFSKILRWNGAKKVTGLRMSVEGDAEVEVPVESSSVMVPENSISQDEMDNDDDVSNAFSIVTNTISTDESESASEPFEVVAEDSDAAANDTPTSFGSEPEIANLSSDDGVAFFASKPESDIETPSPSETSDVVIEEEEVATSVAAEADTAVPAETETEQNVVAETETEESADKATEEAADMTVEEILEVTEEMEEITKALPDPTKKKKPPISLKESIKMRSKRVIEFINSPPPPPAPKTKDDEKIEAFVQALGDAAKGTSKEIAKNILGSLRMTAANALTKSLPEEDRAKLLERMNVPAEEEEEEEEEEIDDDDEEEVRASIAEEIAAAKAEQARRSEELWEAEKESLVKQMEEAANARVENELAIQKQRLVDEMKTMEESMVQSKQELEDEKLKLEGQLVDMDKRVQEIESDFSEVADLQNLIQKREQQKTDLAKMEDDLREKMQEIENQKKLIAERSEELQAAEAEAAEAEKTSNDQEGVISEVADAPADAASVHPVLGQLVCDLGYKRVYLTSSETLGTLPIWKKQRIYRHSRARSMALDKAKNMENGFPGAIGLAEDREGNLSVLDGQHRVGMMQMLREMVGEEGSSSSIPSEMKGYFDKILVEVYPNLADSVDDDTHAESVFLEINKAEPVKLVDMPGVASARDNKIITQAVQRLEEQFPQMFSASQKCRVPNVNIDNLRNNIFGANIMKRHRLRSGKQLFDWLLVQNAAVGASYELDAGRREAISENAWQKASENAFYLGLESSWLYM